MLERKADDQFRMQMEGYGLTTARILYRLPDHPAILQTYLWQDYDLAPRFPELKKFLDFWRREIEGVLHTIEVAHAKLIKPAEWRKVDGLMLLN
ncbi:usg protein [Segnochrobactraceae bacterium EtOH-i3]